MFATCSFYPTLDRFFWESEVAWTFWTVTKETRKVLFGDFEPVSFPVCISELLGSETQEN